MSEMHKISVTDIGEFINSDCCQRNFKLRLDYDLIKKRFPFFGAVMTKLNPILAFMGREREDQWMAALGKDLDPMEGEISLQEFLKRLEDINEGDGVFAREVTVSGRMGEFDLSGRMDFVILLWDGAQPIIRLVECKASRKDKTYHRLQLASYVLLVEAIASKGATIGGKLLIPKVEGVVARIDEETGMNHDPLQLPALDLSQEMTDIRNLLSPGGQLALIAMANLDDLSYQLGPRCDACVNCPICLPESERMRRLELLGLDQASVQVLRESGVESIDGLAELYFEPEKIKSIRSHAGFNYDLKNLVEKAKARRTTLPKLEVMRKESDEWEVIRLPHRGFGQLPSHQSDDGNLIRIFLNIEYDYIEDRVVALSAHITDSDYQCSTGWSGGAGNWTPNAKMSEAPPPQKEMTRPLQGLDISSFVAKGWAGNLEEDDKSEKEMLLDFFRQLVQSVPKVAGTDELRPIHFYVWSQGDMTKLVESCSRAGGATLRALTELLGCRPRCQGDCEQQIFSNLSSEVDAQMALGYTSCSLAVATGLRWYGQKHHWVREVDGKPTDLSKVFRRDIFDFHQPLNQNPDGSWAELDEIDSIRVDHQIRTRFSSDISIPYWYMMWGFLDKISPEHREKVRGALKPYADGGKEPMIRAMLKAKPQALRWVEERLYQNWDVAKPPIPVKELISADTLFEERYDLVNACLDFMRLDRHVHRVDWISKHLLAPATRVNQGLCLPIRNIRFVQESEGTTVLGQLDLEAFDLDLEAFLSTCYFQEDDMIRLTPYSGQTFEGQKPSQLMKDGLTCIIKVLDTTRGVVNLSCIPGGYKDDISKGYIATSIVNTKMDWNYGLIDDSISDFVRRRADIWLDRHREAAAIKWFSGGIETVRPNCAAKTSSVDTFRTVLEKLKKHGRNLDEIQVEACLDGLGTRVQLLLGPPGTGKTNTTAAAILVRLAACPGHKLLLVGASTNTAVDELMDRIRDLAPWFRKEAEAAGLTPGQVRALRLVKNGTTNSEEIGEQDWYKVREELKRADVVLGGTVSGLLKMAESAEKQGSSMAASCVVVDEASMMVFPEFLALATLVSSEGSLMLAGDHMQLAPIVAHDWANETREQITRLQPHESAYISVRRYCGQGKDARIMQSALTRTYRLIPEVRDLIARPYLAEGVELQCFKSQKKKRMQIQNLADIWKEPGVFLVEHGEHTSSKINEFEAELIGAILDAQHGPASERMPGEVAIITPHRAQRSLLKQRLGNKHAHDLKMIDTVERMQGGECGTIIVSGTQSDPMAISEMAEFILNLNRTNVIFSRTKERLIVVCSSSLLDAVPKDIDDYRSAMLWKHLRQVCDTTVLEIDGYDHPVRIKVPGKFWDVME